MIEIILNGILGIFILIFLYINIKISYEDYKNKIIKNKYLLLLILLFPFFYILLYGNNLYNINIGIINILILITIFSILYYNKVLPPGDIKYMFILSLYLSNISLIFFGVIGILILVKIILNYFYFIFFSLKNTSKIKFPKIEYKKIAIFVRNFLIIILSVNIINIYIQNNFNFGFDETRNLIYYTFFLMLSILGIRLSYSSLSKYIKNNSFIFIIYKHFPNFYILFLLIINYYFLKNENLYSLKYYLQIFIVFITIFFIIKSFKIMITQNEEKFININTLKKGDIVDKDFLIKIFGQYRSIIEYLIRNNIIASRNFFKNLENPINENDKNIILNIYDTINKRNRIENNGYSQINQIKIFNTFGFGPYIFFSFLITIIFFYHI